DGPGGDRPGSRHDVVIVEDDSRRLAAEFQRATRDALAAERGDPPSGDCGTREGDLVDVRVSDEVLGCLALRRDHVEDARRKTGPLARFRSRYPDPGASGEDLTTTVQPASRAGATLFVVSPGAPFHGTMAPTTPTGSLTTSASSPPS